MSQLKMKGYRKYHGNDSKFTKQEKEYLFAPKTQGQGSKYATFTSMKEKIVQEAQKKFKYSSDVAKLLKDGKLIDLSTSKPKMLLSLETDSAKQKVEQRMYEIDYQEEVSHFLDRKTHLEENMKKIYTEIFTKYCTRRLCKMHKRSSNMVQM